MDIHVISDRPDGKADVAGLLGDLAQCIPFPVDDIAVSARSVACSVIDADLSNVEHLSILTKVLQGRARLGRVRIVMVDKSARAQFAIAASLGATHVLTRPLSREALTRALFRDGIPREGNPRDIRTAGVPAGIVRSFETSSAMFSRLLVNPDCPVGTAKMVETASEETIHAIGKSGLSEWISAVNTHHSATFRHCLLVNGLAVAFAQSLGFRHDDVLQLSVASAVHDIGKARIPLEILDKPSRLNASEVKTVRAHPLHGLEMLRQSNEFSATVADAVVHHHELLDGSGYPHGLKGADIPDLTQLVTIVDIFSALIEPRTYKATMSGQEAYGILQGMHGKLDPALLEAFAAVVAACPDSGALAIPA
jgi:putative nucleotidyltransferase with HDIG domain